MSEQNTATSPVATETTDSFAAEVDNYFDKMEGQPSEEVTVDVKPEESSNSEVSDEANRDEATSDVEQKAQETEETQEGKQEKKTNSRTEKRIKQLLEQRKQAGEQVSNLREESVKLKAALKYQIDEVQRLKTMLSDYEDLDSAEFKLKEIERKDRLGQDYQAQLQKARDEMRAEQQEILVQEYKAQVVTAMEDALEDRPYVSEKVLKERVSKRLSTENVAFEKLGDVFSEEAGKIEEEVLASLEPKILSKHKAKLEAPNPVKPDGNYSKTWQPESEEELVRSLEEEFGHLFKD